MKIDGVRICVCALICLMAGGSGCVVGQPPGKGKMSRQVEATRRARYFLYLPEDYVKSEGKRPPDKKWPIVVTFHGMRPWDSSGRPAREWQQEADRYGFVVVAPVTRVSDLLGEIPIRRVSKSLKHDELGTLAILDEVTAKYDVDPNHVLTTSWSMGGYLAHYMINRHPDRFSCLAVRQSNFSADILDPSTVPRYRDSKIAVFYTRNDFAICRRESQQAVAWYQQHGFDVTTGVVERMGHQRTPETAAAIFAKTCNAEPKTPPAPLARIKLTSIPADKVAAAAPKMRQVVARQNSRKAAKARRAEPQPSKPNRKAKATLRKPQPKTRAERVRSKPRAKPPSKPPRQAPAVVRRAKPPAAVAVKPPPPRRTPTKPTVTPAQVASARPTRSRAPIEASAARLGKAPSTVARKSSSPPEPRSQPREPRTVRQPMRTKPVSPAATQRPEPARLPQKPPAPRANASLNIRLSAYIGISPMLVSYTVQMPSHLRDGADVLWIDNGQPMSRGISGQKSLSDPGQHKIEVLVVGKDNREYRTSKTVTVLERLSLDND